MFDMDDVKRLIETGGENVLSVYLKIDPTLPENQPSIPNPAWKIAFKNGLSKIDQSFNDKNSRGPWDAIRQKASTQLEHYTPAGKGLIMLVSMDDLVVHELPVPPHDNIVTYGKPHILPLTWLLGRNKPYLIVLVDKDEARFLSSYMNQIDHVDAMESERYTYDFEQKTMKATPISPQASAGANAPGGNYRDLFDKKMDTWIARFHSDVAEHATKYMKNHGLTRLIIGGDQKSAHGVEDFLHQSIRKTLAGILAVPNYISDRDVLKRVQPTATDFENQKELQQVTELINLAKAEGGRGVLGQEKVALALERQQVAELVCVWPPEDEHKLNDLLMEAFRLGVEIGFVSGQAAEELRAHGSLAARLYYALETAPSTTS